MARGLLDAGHELDIFSIKGVVRRKHVVHPLVARYNLMDRHKEPRTPDRWLERYAAAPGALRRAWAQHGTTALRTLPPAHFDRRWMSLRVLFEAAMIDDGDYDILHCQFASVAPVVLQHRHIGTLRGKLVVHVRGYDITQELQVHGPDLYREVFAEADWFVANSRHFRDVAIAAGAPSERIEVILSGLDLDAFPFRPPPPAAGPVRLVGVGRMVEKKGFCYLIEALAKLRAQGHDVTLDLVGDGPLFDQLQRQAGTEGVAEHVRFHGAVPADAVARFLRESHIFVAASVTASDGDQDAATNTVKEAMATGVPVVATAHGGMPEIVEDGVTGMLVPERDAQALATKLAELIGAPALWEPMARRARAKVEDTASNAIVNSQILELYERLVTGLEHMPIR